MTTSFLDNYELMGVFYSLSYRLSLLLLFKNYTFYKIKSNQLSKAAHLRTKNISELYQIMINFEAPKFNEYILIQLRIFSNQFPAKQNLNVFFKSIKICYMLFISLSFIITSSLFAYRNSSEFTVALKHKAFSIVYKCWEQQSNWI